MNPLLINSGEYNIESENACTLLLTRFSPEYIFDVCEYAINTRELPSIVEKPNAVNALETSFTMLKEQFPADIENIESVRDETYLQIIQTLCDRSDLVFTDNTDDQYHMVLAQYMYCLLASNYLKCMTQFFSKYIYLNRYDIYDGLKLGDMKKNRDSGTFYNTNVYKKDLRLGMIITNIDLVVNDLLVHDFEFNEILDLIFADPIITNLIMDCIRPKDDFFDLYKHTLQSNASAICLNNIVSTLHTMYVSVCGTDTKQQQEG